MLVLGVDASARAGSSSSRSSSSGFSSHSSYSRPSSYSPSSYSRPSSYSSNYSRPTTVVHHYNSNQNQGMGVGGTILSTATGAAIGTVVGNSLSNHNSGYNSGGYTSSYPSHMTPPSPSAYNNSGVPSVSSSPVIVQSSTSWVWTAFWGTLGLMFLIAVGFGLYKLISSNSNSRPHSRY